MDMLPQQLHLFSRDGLIAVPVEAPVCLFCKTSSHIQEDCRILNCSECFHYGHNKEDYVKNCASALSTSVIDEPAAEVMDAVEA